MEVVRKRAKHIRGGRHDGLGIVKLPAVLIFANEISRELKERNGCSAVSQSQAMVVLTTELNEKWPENLSPPIPSRLLGHHLRPALGSFWERTSVFGEDAVLMQSPFELATCGLRTYPLM